MSPPSCHGHLQHSTDSAAGQHLQQLREVGEALRRGPHLPLEPEPSVMGAWPRDPGSPPLPGQALTSGSPIAESNPAEMSTSSGSNCGRGHAGMGRKETGAGVKEAPPDSTPHPEGSILLWCGGGYSGQRIALPFSCHQDHSCPPCSYLKGHGEQHMEEGGHVVSISHPNLWPWGISAGPRGRGL